MIWWGGGGEGTWLPQYFGVSGGEVKVGRVMKRGRAKFRRIVNAPSTRSRYEDATIPNMKRSEPAPVPLHSTWGVRKVRRGKLKVSSRKNRAKGLEYGVVGLLPRPASSSSRSPLHQLPQQPLGLKLPRAMPLVRVYWL